MPLIIDLVLLGMGAYWLLTSTTALPLWKGISLGGGLVPAIASGVMVLLLAANIVRILRTEKVGKAYFAESFRAVNWKELAPLLIALAVLAGTQVVGLFLSLTVMLFAWLKCLSHYSLKRSAVVTLLVMLFLFAVFKLWLKLPLPQGVLGLV